MKGQERRYMKGIIKFLVLALVLMTGFKVSALESTTITYNKLHGIAYNITVDGKFMSNTVTQFQLGDRIAYCIEPGVEINEKYYDIYTDWSAVDMSDELKSTLEKIGYYGYEYPGHQTSRYYIATQELIWKAVRPDMESVWTTGENKTGEIIDITAEKDEIMRLVNEHDLLPSFSGEVVKGAAGSKIVLEDENNVLQNFEISESKYHDIKVNGNSLEITLNDEKAQDEKLTLTRKKEYYDSAPLLVYSKGDSQKLASLRITMDDIKTDLTLENYEEIDVPDTGVNTSSMLILSLIIFGSGVFLRVKSH